jgi:oligopeptide transport system substrate-binding protein
MSSSRWRYLVLSLVAIGALFVLAACGDDEGDGGGGEESPGGESPGGGERIQGGTLRIQQIEPQSLDPHFSSFAQDISVQRMLWRGLYSLDAENNPVPAYADGDPEISTDGKTFTVSLKEGALWSDGDDLLAEDWVLGIHRTCNPVNAGEYQYLLSNVVGCDDYYNALAGPDGDPGTGDDLSPGDPAVEELRSAVGVRAVDDLTVEFTLQNPGPTFQTILSLWMTFPVPSHLLPDPGETWPANPDVPDALAYNGPYVLTGYTAGTNATFEPNPNWSEEYSPVGAAPTLDSFELRWIDDFAVSQRAYENDELEMSTVDLTQLEATVQQFEPTGEYQKHVKAGTRGLQMNQDHPPLDNKDVRMGIGKAIDWETMIINCYSGAHAYTTTWIPEGVDGGQPTDYRADEYAYDVAAAQALVEGVAGMDREFVLVVRVGTESECAGQFIQEQLRTSLNMNVKLEAVEGPVRSARFREESFDLFPGGWNQDYPDPENWIIGLFDTDGPLNHYNCSNPEIDQLIEENQFNIEDEDARVAAYERINEIIVDEVCGIFVFYHEADNYLVKPNVVGMLENTTVQNAYIPGDWAAEAWGVSE